jgi:methionine sulfoxide reductase heme-binding subunit
MKPRSTVKPAEKIRILKVISFLGLSAPLLVLAWAFFQVFTQGFSPLLGINPVAETIHYLGLWALKILLLGLAITPLVKLMRWNLLMSVRRMIGLFGFTYVALHLAAFFVFDLELSLVDLGVEIAKRPYILVGMTAFALLIPLAITSTNAMIKRLGARNWKRLHKAAYVIGLLGSVHFLMARKGDQIEPKIYLAVLILLLGWRAFDALKNRKWFKPALTAAAVSVLGLFAIGQAKAASPHDIKSGSAPVLVELFTSQECSSCPAADEVLAALALRPDIVAISWPVSYWPRLGWTDSFARSAHAARQRGYQQRLGLASVYTPQMIIDGQFDVIGSRRDRVQAAIAQARAQSTDVRPDIVPNQAIVVPKGVVGKVHALWLKRSSRVAVRGGENARRTLHYSNVVLADQMIGTVAGAGGRFTWPQAPVGADALAVLIEAPSGIKGVALAKLTAHN